jgi:L-cysteine S-thiosulfotransferase
MYIKTCVRLAALLAIVLSGGCASTGWDPAPKPMDFACYGENRPCANLSVRAPVMKKLEQPLNGDPERGKQIAFARNKGNCLACHAMNGGTQMGNRGPDLTTYGTQGRSEAETFALVYDMRAFIPQTLMPPIGTNAILTEQEIRDVVAFLHASR